MPVPARSADPILVALDVGSSSVRALAFDHRGASLDAGVQRPYEPTTTPDGGVEIDADMRPELNRLARLAATCPGMRIEIHGYSDGRGSAFINRSMAQARAQSVADYLIAAGIAPNRLAAMGLRDRHQPDLLTVAAALHRRSDPFAHLGHPLREVQKRHNS